MTNETEKKFFDAFGIEAKLDGSDFNKSIRANYPEITDRILLELIVVNNKNAPAVGDTLEELKAQVLFWCIKYKCKIYHQVRALFRKARKIDAD